MAITIKRVKNERGVSLDSLNIGDTFLYDNRVGVIVNHNGNSFPLDLTTCCEMHYRESYPYGPVLRPEDIVLPVDVELAYKVVG
jgi:hypothetical protein